MQTRFYRAILIAALAALLASLPSGLLAQGADGGGAQLEQQAGELDRARTRDQIRTHIDTAPGLDEGQRSRMHNNLNACIELSIPPAALAGVFPDANGNGASAESMLRLQEQVMRMAREGLTVEPLLNKAQEGRTKGVPDPALERACERMEQYTRTASRMMSRFQQSGIDVPGEPAGQRRMQGEMARQMWRGMEEPDYDQLRERAQQRLRDGSCDASDVVAASEVATRLREAGVERARAMEFAGAAIQQGYRYQEMRQLQIIVAARAQRGEPMRDLLEDMEHCVGAGMGPGEMYGYMIRHGWMGPGDMYGPGGNQPTDTKGHGGGQGGGQQGGGGNDTGNRHGGGNKPSP